MFGSIWRTVQAKLGVAFGWLLFIALPSGVFAASLTSSGKLGQGLVVPTPTPTATPTALPSLSPTPLPTPSENPLAQAAAAVAKFIAAIVAAIATAIAAAIAATAAAVAAGFQPVFQEAGRIIKLTPPVVAYNFPWLLLFYLLLLIILHTRQAIREENETRAILKAMEREKVIADEKENFIILTSHHFKTWTTYIRNGIDLLATNKTIGPEMLAALNEAGSGLSVKVDELLKTISEQSVLQELVVPDIKKASRKLYASPFLIGPLIIVALLGIGATYLFTNLAHIQMPLINQIIQLLAYLSEASVLYLVLRSRLAKRTNVQNALNLLAHQRAIDEARTKFIQDSVIIVGGALEAFSAEIAEIRSNEQAKYIIDGYQKLINLISKFQLAITVQSGEIAHEEQKFALKELVDGEIEEHRTAAEAKKIELTVEGTDGALVQNTDRLRLVLGSLIDNAIKFSPEGGKVVVHYAYDPITSKITVNDSGPGMSEEQVAGLFQPFTRTESALVFNYEGMGFSLYLDRLIMKYLEGDVSISSQPGVGTAITVSMRSDLSDIERIVIDTDRVKAPRVKISKGLIASTIFLVTALVVVLYFSSTGAIQGFLLNIWPIMAMLSIFVVGSWLAIVFGIVERDSRR